MINWSLNSTTSQNPGSDTYLQMSGYFIGLYNPIKYIDGNETNFKDGTTISANSSIVFLKNLLIQNKNYENVYKRPISGTITSYFAYYSKVFGLIKFEMITNNEIYELMN